MSKIGDFLSWMFIAILLIWLGTLAFASSPCARVHRSAWPVIYVFNGFELATRNWTSSETKLSILLWKAKSAVAVQKVFERTVYGEGLACSK